LKEKLSKTGGNEGCGGGFVISDGTSCNNSVSSPLQDPVTARSKAWFCGRSPAEIVGSNPTRGMDVCRL
jgi:hypothetical protein